MKTVCNSLMLLAVSAVWAGAAQVQDEPAVIHQGVFTNFPSANITLDLKTEPQLALDSKTQLTGLVVDCLTPQQTWKMLNPSAPARDLPKPIPQFQQPVAGPAQNHDLAVHEPDFALLRLSFP